MNHSNLILTVNCFATAYMVGLIWMVQVVHYPLFKFVGKEMYTEYQKRHQTLTTLVVGPPMLVEAFSTVLLSWYPPPEVGNWMIFTGIGLLFVIWISTAVLQVPCHGKLLAGFDSRVHLRLVLSNWIRTTAWTSRGLLTVWMLASVLSST